METPIARSSGAVNFDKIVYEHGKFDQTEVESIIFVYRSEVNEAVEDQSSRAYRAIRNGIVTGRYRPGQRLVESTIASLEGVSRTPVRAALRWLEREGVVDIEKRRGARVRRLSAEQVSDPYELRARIEGHACELAASRASKEDAAELCALADVFDTSLAELPEDRDFAGVRAANAALHRKIAKTGGNPFLVSALDATLENPLVLRAFQNFSQQELGRSGLFHQLIVSAIREGRSDRAARLMIEPTLQARDKLVAAFDSAFEESRE